MPKLLIVDDEIEICDFLKDFFEGRGYHVVTALSGEEALGLIEKEDPRIVLLDIRMPGINGLETLKLIKERYPHVRVIMVTAIETQEDMEEAIRLGADNYITKPLSLEYLENDVHEKLTGFM